MSTPSHPATGRMIWTFARGHQRLEIRREMTREGVELIVTGGDAPERTPFGDLAALVAHQSRIEGRLVEGGWSLVSFEPERRGHEERRREVRGTLDRRRWWTDPAFRAAWAASAPLGIVVRAESIDDYAAIRALNAAAFGRTDEADLVERLRAQGAVLAAFVAAVENTAVGYVMFSRALIETAAGNRPAAVLAPLAVTPDMQRRGIGASLVRYGVGWLQAQREQVVLVLGDARYYARFGFSAEAAQGLDSPFPPASLMARQLAPGALTGSRGRLRYPSAFGL